MSRRLTAGLAAFMLLSALGTVPAVKARSAADAPGGKVTVTTGPDRGVVRIRSTRFR